MKFSLLFLSLIFIYGCSEQPSSSRYVPSRKQKLANELRQKVAKKLRKEKNLIPCGSGGQMMDEIKMLALSFYYYKPIDIDEGRELLVYTVDEFVNAVNADERIRPYLYNYPFKSKNIEIRIFLRHTDGTHMQPGELSFISAIDNELDYYLKDSESPYLKEIHSESYEEAVQKVEDSSLIRLAM